MEQKQACLSEERFVSSSELQSDFSWVCVLADWLDEQLDVLKACLSEGRCVSSMER